MKKWFTTGILTAALFSLLLPVWITPAAAAAAEDNADFYEYPGIRKG
ncbi:hypothetical protein Q5741_19800 [Paenibacillus sp. JX-17]|uniref:Uncharacterized protein n=1 Tax=Paenibacillus lacisoli TaxID=3064525 RepID=A0ABT9CLW2_9BACL|nr:hypothetical protein [Paenibacillus sp. JX-17]MDO7908636.1 hypothetical protein [Paenibacillus sp. JX-17]